jgi:hypothetical protein
MASANTFANNFRVFRKRRGIFYIQAKKRCLSFTMHNAAPDYGSPAIDDISLLNRDRTMHWAATPFLKTRIAY